MEDAHNWLNEIYSKRWSGIFRNYCANKFAKLMDPDELMEDARQILAMTLHRKIEQNDRTVLSKGFIMVSFRNAVTDVHRKQWGRGKPRAWLGAFGEFGQRIYELYCLARLGRTEVLEVVDSEFSSTSEFSAKKRAAELLHEMDRQMECQGKALKESPPPDESGDCVQIPGDSSPEDRFESAQAQALRAYLFGYLEMSYEGIGHLVDKIQSGRGNLSDPNALDADQRFIIHATLSGELTEKQMGELMGLSVRQVRYKRAMSFEVIKKMIKKAGLALTDLLDESANSASPVSAEPTGL